MYVAVALPVSHSRHTPAARIALVWLVSHSCHTGVARVALVLVLSSLVSKID